MALRFLIGDQFRSYGELLGKIRGIWKIVVRASPSSREISCCPVYFPQDTLSEAIMCHNHPLCGIHALYHWTELRSFQTLCPHLTHWLPSGLRAVKVLLQMAVQLGSDQHTNVSNLLFWTYRIPRLWLGPQHLGGGQQCAWMPGKGQAGRGLWEVGGAGGGGKGEWGLWGILRKHELPGKESQMRCNLGSESQPGGDQRAGGVLRCNPERLRPLCWGQREEVSVFPVAKPRAEEVLRRQGSVWRRVLGLASSSPGTTMHTDLVVH